MKWQGEIKTTESERGDFGKTRDMAVVESGEDIVGRGTTLVLSVISFLGSMVFWSQNITGNAVLEFGKSSANWVGAILFILAIIGFLVYIQKRK